MSYSSIEKKQNFCSVSGCNKPSGTWKKCVHHRSLEYAERSRKKREAIGLGQDKLEAWFLYQFKKHGGISAETGRPLNYSRRVVMHILPKKKGIGGYPYFATHEMNGLLGEWWVHDVVDKGSPEQRKALKCWKLICDIRKMLLEEVGMTYDENYWLNYKT